MIDGSSGELTPDEAVSASTNDDGYTCIYLSNQRQVVLSSARPIRITEFLLRVTDICQDGQPLTAKVVYYLSTSDVLVRTCNYSFSLDFFN